GVGSFVGSGVGSFVGSGVGSFVGSGVGSFVGSGVVITSPPSASVDAITGLTVIINARHSAMSFSYIF
ncbi:MAG: hypothetical protein IKM02_06410, partial [Clostridia bacterium]|nr:hypothetical protein [Clostridia bacterium]